MDSKVACSSRARTQEWLNLLINVTFYSIVRRPNVFRHCALSASRPWANWLSATCPGPDDENRVMLALKHDQLVRMSTSLPRPNLVMEGHLGIKLLRKLV